MAYENQHKLRDGAVLVYTRSSSARGRFQARVRVPGTDKYVVKALKTASLSEALKKAEDLYDDLRFAHRQGLDITEPEMRFRALCQRFYNAHKNQLSIHRQRLHQGNANRYFLPFLGDYKVADTADATFEKYWDWRINFYSNKAGTSKIPSNAARRPSQKTLDMEAGMLRQMFRWGKRMGFVKREPWIKSPKVKHEKGTNRRPTFSVEEWEKIYLYMRDWVNENDDTNEPESAVRGPTSRHRLQRQILRNYLLFMANSGLRPNEARQLKWRDVRIENTTDGSKIVFVEVAPTTKTGARTTVCCHGTDYYLERLRKVSNHTGPDDFVFCSPDGKPVENFNKTFAALLSNLNLLNDSFGSRRSVYSLRHFYCTQRILTGDIPILILAQNMGTSVTYIQKHYSHVLTVQKARELANKKMAS